MQSRGTIEDPVVIEPAIKTNRSVKLCGGDDAWCSHVLAREIGELPGRDAAKDNLQVNFLLPSPRMLSRQFVFPYTRARYEATKRLSQ